MRPIPCTPDEQARNVTVRSQELLDDTLQITQELLLMLTVTLEPPPPRHGTPPGEVRTNITTRHAELHARLETITDEATTLRRLTLTHPGGPTMTRTQGFTLIELLVVIAIIGVLAAILLPTFSNAQKKPYDVAAQQCGRAIVAAQIPYRAGTGSYTSDPAQLGPDVAEACRDAGVQVGVHNTAPTAATSAYLMSGADANSFAFTAFHPRGTGFYRYWNVSPAPIAEGNRLNTLFPY